MKRIYYQFTLILLILSACSPGTGNETPTPFSPTEPLATVTSTPEPMAAWVNGEGILLEDYQAELLRYQSTQLDPSSPLSSDDQTRVLDNMIGEVLLAQGSVANGHTIDDNEVQEHISNLIAEIGGEETFNSWLSTQHYTMTTFSRALHTALLAGWMRDSIAVAVPTTAEQVHARQILVLSQDLADQIYAQLQAGTTFTNLAEYYDPITGGDLGWFPRGYLTQPLIEEAAFSLAVGSYSEIIYTDFGYHIIQVIDANAEQPLAADVLLHFQQQAVDNWVSDHRNSSTIEVINP